MRIRWMGALWLSSIFLAMATSPFAQQQSGNLAFEVASIREVGNFQDGQPHPRALKVFPTRIEITNAPMAMLIPLAYGVKPYQVVGPDWLKQSILETKLFDVRATIPGGHRPQEVPLMLRTLLAQRFGLTAHVEKRPMPVYELVVGKSGHTMRPAGPLNELEGTVALESGDKLISDSTSTPFVTSSLVEDHKVRMVVSMNTITVLTETSAYSQRLNPQQKTRVLEARALSMSELVAALEADKPILDKTDLPGLYQFRIELPLSLAASRILQRTRMTDRNGNPIQQEPEMTSVFKGVESLGLKLESRRSPVDVLVIDKLSQVPTEN